MTFFASLHHDLKRVVQKMTAYHYGLVATMLVWGTYFIWLWVNVFRRDTDGNIVAGHSLLWADWSAHITYASVFAYRDPSDWFTAHPLFSQAKFSYPFVPDAVSGLLMRIGVDIIPAFVVPSILVTFAMLYVVFRFFLHFTQRVKATFIAICLFFLSGGFGFLYALQQYGTDYEWYTHIAEHGVYFINFIVGEMIPQRTFLFGLPIALSIILLLERIVSATQRPNSSISVLAGILAGSLAIIHPHSLIVVFVVSCFYLVKYYSYFKDFFIYAVTTAVLIGIYWLLFLNGSNSGSVPHLQLGWMAGDTNLIVFEVLNFGIFVPLGIYAAVKQKLHTHPLFMSGIFLFITCHIFSFQTWEWDNTKIFTYAYLFILIPITQFLVELWSNRRHKVIYKLSALTLAILLGVSGTMDVVRLSQIDNHTYQIISTSDQKDVAQFRQIAPSGSIVLTNQNGDNPYALLGNTQALMSYQGWLWSYGIDFEKTQSDIGNILGGASNSIQLINYYQISFIVVDDKLRQTYSVNEDFLKQFPVVHSTQSTTIYKVRP